MNPMSEPLSREDFNSCLMQFGATFDPERAFKRKEELLAHDAAQRARMAALEQEHAGCKASLRHILLDNDKVHAQLATLTAERDRLREAVLWALGYTDFRARKDGDGPYWWRTELRSRALPDGISEADIQAYQAKALRGEGG